LQFVAPGWLTFDQTIVTLGAPEEPTPGLEIIMNKSVVSAALAAFVLGAATTGVILASAQPAQPPGVPPAAEGGPMPHGPWAGRGPMEPGPGSRPWAMRMSWHHGGRMAMMRTFALIHRADDRKLTPPDVQKIVEAFLLWNGNHTWKVLDVKTEGDAIGFDLATGQGSVIAHFTMDPKTAHLTRVS
jgi:hypothetical protein